MTRIVEPPFVYNSLENLQAGQVVLGGLLNHRVSEPGIVWLKGTLMNPGPGEEYL